MSCESLYEATDAADISRPAVEVDWAAASGGPTSRATNAAYRKR
jgi:hypothetical protein